MARDQGKTEEITPATGHVPLRVVLANTRRIHRNVAVNSVERAPFCSVQHLRSKCLHQEGVRSIIAKEANYVFVSAELHERRYRKGSSISQTSIYLASVSQCGARPLPTLGRGHRRRMGGPSRKGAVTLSKNLQTAVPLRCNAPST